MTQRGLVAMSVSIVIFAVVLVASGHVQANSTPPTIIAMAPTSTFRVEVDGAEVRSAETYVGETGLLILGCDLKEPLLVAKIDKTVRYVSRENVLRDPEGNVTLKGSPSGPICLYQVSAGQIVFKAEGRNVRLSPRAPLLGQQTLEAVLDYSPDYAARVKGYKPNTEAVAYLSRYVRPTDLEIYFGSWCSVCEAWVPRLIKSLQEAANPRLQTRFIGLSKAFTTEPISRVKQLQGVPTIILLQSGKEIGRLQGRPEQGTIEEALVKVLRTAGG